MRRGWLSSRSSTEAAPGSTQQDDGLLIEMRQVMKVFKNASGEYTVLKGINAAFRESEFASIVGRSGSGKSTLLNMMTGIDHPTSGMVRIGGVTLHTLDESRMSVWRGKNLGIVFQFFQLLPMLTLLENVMLPMDFCDLYAPPERETRALALLKMVGLEGLEHKYPAAVAGGQQQSAAVARALANDPPILVADEPTGNLDSKTAERVLSIFEEQVARGKTVLMVTHDSSLAQRAQRILVISDGELINELISNSFAGAPHNLLLQMSRTAQVCQYTPETLLYRPGQPGPGWLQVQQGAFEVLLAGRASFGRPNSPVVAGRVEPGEQFSLLSAQALGPALLGLRADGPVEALVVDPLPQPALLEETQRVSAQLWVQRSAEVGKRRKGAQ